MKGVSIRPFRKEDWPEVKRIYEEGIQTESATFEVASRDLDQWEKYHIGWSKSVVLTKEQIVGWAALSRVSDRPVYAGVAEVSIYIDKNFRGKGIGSRLLEYLVDISEKSGIWMLQAGVFPENIASTKLLAKFSFRIVGTREKIGKLHNVWRDVLLLERRS